MRDARGPPGGGRAIGGSDFLQLRPGRRPAEGLTAWLAGRVRAGGGRRPAGAGRAAAGHPRAGRATSASPAAWSSRRTSGWSTRAWSAPGTGAGTVVAPRAGDAGRAAHGRRPPSGPRRPGCRCRWPAGVDLDLSPGVPDLSAFPRAAWLRAERAVLEPGQRVRPGLRRPAGQRPAARASWPAGWPAPAACGPAPTTSSWSPAWPRPSPCSPRRCGPRGTTAIAVEDPGSRGARDELAHWGLRPVRGAGRRRTAWTWPTLVATGARGGAAHPGPPVPDRRRAGPAPPPRAARLGGAADGLVIEDDYDAEHRYDRAPVPALQALRAGPRRPHRQHLQDARPGHAAGLADPAARTCTPTWSPPSTPATSAAPRCRSWCWPELLAGGDYDRHLRLVRARQRARRDAVLAALREHLPSARVEGVAAGLHLLLTLPGHGRRRRRRPRGAGPAGRRAGPPAVLAPAAGPDRPASSSATPPTRRTACATRYAASPPRSAGGEPAGSPMRLRHRATADPYGSSGSARASHHP